MNAHRLLQFAIRWTGRVERFLMCAQTLGFRNAILIFGGRSKGGGLRSVALRKNVSFSFRSGDWGALTHFYLPGSPFFEAQSLGGVTRILDAGANIGAESVRFLLLYPKAQIVSIELERENFALLQKNTAWAGGRAHCINGALWHEPAANLMVRDSGEGMESFQVSTNQQSGQVARGFSLEEIMSLKDWDEIDILKIDVEGAEKKIFEKVASGFLSKVRCLIVEPHDVYVPGALQSVFNALQQHRFKSYIVGENIVSIRGDLDWVWSKGITL